jgi:DNA-binding XRE family transcriptional regulator
MDAEGWSWRITELKQRLNITVVDLAARANMRRATLADLQGASDTWTSVLIQVYRAAREIAPTITLHDLVAVHGEPSSIVARRHAIRDDMEPMRDLPGVYLGTPLLRHYYAPHASDPLGTVQKLALAANIHPTAMRLLERGRTQPRISTVIQCYRVFLPYDPTLTLHDLVLLPDGDLPPDAPSYAPYLRHQDTPGSPPDADDAGDGPISPDALLALWTQLSPQGQRAAMHYIRALLARA